MGGPKTGKFGDVANRIALSFLGLGMAGLAVCASQHGSLPVYAGFACVAGFGCLFAKEAIIGRGLLTIVFTLLVGPAALLAKCKCCRKDFFGAGLANLWP